MDFHNGWKWHWRTEPQSTFSPLTYSETVTFPRSNFVNSAMNFLSVIGFSHDIKKPPQKPEKKHFPLDIKRISYYGIFIKYSTIFFLFFVNEYFLCVSFDRLLMERRIWWKKDEFLTIDNEWKIDVFGTSRTPVHRFKPESLMSARKLFLTMWGSLRRRDINYH